jgi:hypothetical protein
MAWRVSAGTESGWKFAAPMARRIASEPSPTISAPRHPTKPENTKPLRGAGALDRIVSA